MSESERLKNKVKKEKKQEPDKKPGNEAPPTSSEDPIPLADMKYEEEENRKKYHTKKRSGSEDKDG